VLAGPDHRRPAGRDAPPSRCRLHHGQDQGGGLPLADDQRRIEAVLKIVGEGERLAVDANCKFTREEALAYARALAPLKLRWFEEPCDPLDFALLAEIASVYAPPLATGENLFSTADVEN